MGNSGKHLLLAGIGLSIACGMRLCLAQQPPATVLNSRSLLVSSDIKTIQVLPQHWSDAEARRFYKLTQGSRMLPYTWFLHLEQEDSTNLFRDAEYIRSFGYLPRSPDNEGNPDGLPIGFVRDGNQLGLTCAACHTTQINYKGAAFLIDGGPSLADAEKFMRKLEGAMEATFKTGTKFDRFANTELGQGNNAQARQVLMDNLKEVIEKRSAYNARNLPTPSAPPFGPGRIDAFGAIMNEVAVRFAQVTNNETEVDAPVSYPFLWDTPQHDFVQWNGSARNNINILAGPVFGTTHIGALGRNVGEVLGVFADVDTTNEVGFLRGYASSVNRANLIELEEILEKLWSPQWPAQQFGKIETDVAKEGENHFRENCRGCHLDIRRDDPSRKIKAMMESVGTDETMASNAAMRMAKSGVLEKRILLPFHKLQATERISKLLVHVGERVVIGPQTVNSNEVNTLELDYVVNAKIDLGTVQLSGPFSVFELDDGMLTKVGGESLAVSSQGTQAFTNLSASAFAPFSRTFGAQHSMIFAEDFGSTEGNVDVLEFNRSPISTAKVKYEYKARPLNGIWATAPYLHNGSVPNLDELLKPANARIKRFWVGSREFDVERVGLKSDHGEVEFDTQASPGNSNAGHEYKRVFTSEERKQLIEYLKTL